VTKISSHQTLQDATFPATLASNNCHLWKLNFPFIWQICLRAKGNCLCRLQTWQCEVHQLSLQIIKMNTTEYNLFRFEEYTPHEVFPVAYRLREPMSRLDSQASAPLQYACKSIDQPPARFSYTGIRSSRHRSHAATEARKNHAQFKC
jgi:hypothetical protein